MLTSLYWRERTHDRVTSVLAGARWVVWRTRTNPGVGTPYR
jgi:hypothetical protein